MNKRFNYCESRPLWRATLLQFIDCDISVLSMRCHHCIADGVTQGEIFARICDPQRDDSSSISVSNATVQSTIPVPPNVSPSKSISSSPSLSLSNQKTKDKKNKKKKTKGIASKILFGIMYFIGILMVISKYLMGSLQSEPKSIFKPSKLSEKKNVSYDMSSISLTSLNIRRKQFRFKPTVNDFMLAVICESLSRVISKSKHTKPVKEVTLAIPVNVRNKNVKETVLGNKIGAIVLKAPLSSSLSFEEKLKKIKSQMDFAKKTPEAHFTYVLALFNAMFLPTWLSTYFARKLTNKTTIVCTNVRGPSNKYTFCGKDIKELIGFVPPPMGCGIGFCVFTYNGRMAVSVNIDRNVSLGNDIKGEDTGRYVLKTVLNVLRELGCLNE